MSANNITIGQAIAKTRGAIDAAVWFIYWLSLIGIMILFALMVAGQFVRIGFLPNVQPTAFIYLAGAAWLLKR